MCGGLQHFSVSPRPLGSLLGLGWGWAYGVWAIVGMRVLINIFIFFVNQGVDTQRRARPRGAALLSAKVA